MNTIKAHNLVCPIDDKKLVQQDRQMICENGHTFDIARQGYVNLLPVQHKRSKHPGDSKAMVMARTEFLNSGIYHPIATKLNEIVVSLLPDSNAVDKDICLLDAGCGEGYYLDAVFRENINNDSVELTCIGLDISKEAVLQASKKNKQISWIVATNRQPPIEENSVDIILCLFGFVCVEGFTRVLKPGGKIILVDPGAGHLSELREVIYPEITKTESSKSDGSEIPGFTLLKNDSLKYKTKLINNQQVNHLLLMTPHFYRASKQGREQACALDELDISVDVEFRVFEFGLGRAV